MDIYERADLYRLAFGALDAEEVAFYRVLLRGVPTRWPLLSVGCGEGRLEHALATRHVVVGIDTEPALLALGHGFDALRGDARALPFAADSFGGVLSAVLVFNHLDGEEDMRRAVGEALRVAVPGGVVLVDLLTSSRPRTLQGLREHRDLPGGGKYRLELYDVIEEGGGFARIAAAITLSGGLGRAHSEFVYGVPAPGWLVDVACSHGGAECSFHPAHDPQEARGEPPRGARRTVFSVRKG